MTDETNLPPDVAEAMNTISNLHPHGIPTVEGLAAYRATRTLRDYLLQVTAENALLHESALPDLLRVLMDLYDHGYTTCADHDTVRAVIAKATGDKDFGCDA